MHRHRIMQQMPPCLPDVPGVTTIIQIMLHGNLQKIQMAVRIPERTTVIVQLAMVVPEPCMMNHGDVALALVILAMPNHQTAHFHSIGQVLMICTKQQDMVMCPKQVVITATVTVVSTNPIQTTV